MAISDISHRKRYLAGGNVYLPHIVVIEKIIEETPGILTFHFNFKDEKLKEEFTFESGQFGEYSVFVSAKLRSVSRPVPPGATIWSLPCRGRAG